MSGIISVNGETFPAEKAKIPALDRGLLFADGIFEVLVAFGNKILDVDPHLRRLRRSAEKLDFDIPWTDEQLSFEMSSLTEQLSADKKYIRLLITRGSDIDLVPPDHLVPNKYIYVLPSDIQPVERYQQGIKLKKMRLPLTERGPSAKTGNYLRSILASKKAYKEGFHDVLWVNSQTEITEATRSNIFLIGRTGDQVEIATPTLQSGLLEGITRRTIIDLLHKSQIPVTERIIYEDEIPRFDEAFVCSTVRGVMAVTAIDNHNLHTRRPNSVYNHIERLFLTWVETEIGHRVDWNTGKRVINN